MPPDLVKLTCRKSAPIRSRCARWQRRRFRTCSRRESRRRLSLYAHSGYRSYRTQKTMYSNRLKKNNGKDDGVVAYRACRITKPGWALTSSTRPVSERNSRPAFANTKEGKWIAEHCWNYGFVIRYQKKRKKSHRSRFEPWHLRYVGVQMAQYMHENDLSLEEFTAEWKEAAAEYQAAEM